MLVRLAALGAFLGDNCTYQIGRWLGPAIERRLFAGEKGAHRKAWATRPSTATAGGSSSSAGSSPAAGRR